MTMNLSKLMRKRLLVPLIMAVALAVAFFVMGVMVNHAIDKMADGRCFSSVEETPYRRVGLLLGTARLTRHGNENPYFYHRIDACARLYHAGKIHRILISGDNSRKDYNEPADMKAALAERGVPADSITLDYAGFRTYDSMVRAKKVFGQDSFIVISQHWHNERAIFIALNNDMDVVGYDAKDAIVRKAYVRNLVRETLSKVKAVFDVCIGKRPKYLDEPVIIQ